MPIDLSTYSRAKEDKKNFASGFANSLFSAPLELFGVEATPEAEVFRQQHPWIGLGTQLAGTAVPYAGWAGLSRKIKPLTTFVEGIGNIEKAPVFTSAIREVARFAPFEAGRVAVASGVNDQPLGPELAESAINLGAAGALTGGLSAFRAFGRASRDKIPLADWIEGVDPDAPLQLRLRQMKEAIETGKVKEGFEDLADNRLAEWMSKSRIEEPIGDRHIRSLEGTTTDDARSIDRLFFNINADTKATRTTSPSGEVTRWFAESGPRGRGFMGPTAWKHAATAAGLPDDFPVAGQFFRHTIAESDKSAKRLQNFAGKLTRAGDWYIGREQDDGMYVMLRKFQGETKGKKGDRWVAFKTDEPGKFVPEFQHWNDTMTKWQSWLPDDPAPADAGGLGYKAGKLFNDRLPLQDFAEARKTGSFEGLVQKATGELGRRANEWVTDKLTPTINQFSKNAKAQWIATGAKQVYDTAKKAADDAVLGPRHNADDNLLWASIRGTDRPPNSGLDGMIRGLSDEEFGQLMDAWRQSPNPEVLGELFKSGRLSEAARATFSEGEAVAISAINSYNKTAQVAGATPARILWGHGGIGRKWSGNVYIGLSNESGELKALASGFNREAAQKRAKFIQDKMMEEGVSLSPGEPWLIGSGKLPRELSTVLKTPGFLEERSGIRGFDWDFGVNPSKDEYVEAFHKSISDRYRAEAQLAIDNLYNGTLEKLKVEDPHTADMLIKRLNQMAGVEDDVTRKINEWVDPILGPMLGKGSAGKIVNAMNAGLFNLQFGFGNMAYGAMNLVGTLQTIIPEVAFVLNGAPERVAGYYTPQLLKSAAGKPVLMSALDPLKVYGQAIRTLAAPDDGFRKIFARAADEGVIDPKFLEDYGGQNSRLVGNLKEAMKGPNGFARWVGAVSEFVPAASERLSRAMATASSYRVGKDILGLDGEELYLFIKQFNDRTMYRYATADRSQVLTNPIGRAFGSMKNWINHYLSNMLVYSGEATRGNIAPLAWQMATTGALGGAAALPFGPAIGNWFADQAGEKNLMTWMYDSMDPQMADALYLGLPAVMGTSMSSATASPVRDANMLFNLAHASRFDAASKAIGAALDTGLATGQHPGRDEQVTGSLARAFAPKTAFRYMQVYDNPGLKSLTTGYPIVDELGPWNKVLYTLGFQPNDIEKSYEAFESMLKEKKSMEAEVRRYGEALADAVRDQDSAAAENVLSRAMVAGVDISKVTRSMQARLDKDSGGMIERNFSEAQQQAYKSVIGER